MKSRTSRSGPSHAYVTAVTGSGHRLGAILGCMLVVGCVSGKSEPPIVSGSDSSSSAGPATTGTEVGDSDGSGSTDGAEPMWDPAEHCETRQLLAPRFEGDEGELAGPTDVQAICNEDGRVIALHRPGPVACDTPPVELEPCLDPGGECMVDSDCNAIAPGGTCASFDGLGGACACVIPCAEDADCPADRACLCRSGVQLGNDVGLLVEANGCLPADCRTDGDCGEGAQCSMMNPLNTCVQLPQVRLTCRDSTGCASDDDCATDGLIVCSPGVSGGPGWECVGDEQCQ